MRKRRRRKRRIKSRRRKRRGRRWKMQSRRRRKRRIGRVNKRYDNKVNEKEGRNRERGRKEREDVWEKEGLRGRECSRKLHTLSSLFFTQLSPTPTVIVILP